MVIRKIILVCGLLSIISTACTETKLSGKTMANATEVKPEVSILNDNWWQRQFVISTFSSIRPGDDIEKFVEQFHNAGLTVLEGSMPAEYATEYLSHEEQLRVLKACQKYGLRYVLVDHNRLTGVETPKKEDLDFLVKEYGCYESLGGYYLWDEPGRHLFDSIAKTRAALKALDPKRLTVLAGVPSYGPYHYPEAYPDYVKGIAEIISPDVLSFDFYGVYEANVINPELYHDLAVWQSQAGKLKRPLWFYLASCNWNNIAKPTRAILRFQAYTAVAFGAKGLQYFMVRDFIGGPLNFNNAPLDSNGNPNEIFGDFGELNHELLRQSDTIMSMNFQKAVFTSPVPEHQLGLDGQYLLSSAPDNLLLAFHQSAQGSVYLVVVNRDITQNRQIQLIFKQPVRLKKLLERQAIKSKDGEISFNLDAGDGCIFEFSLSDIRDRRHN